MVPVQIFEPAKAGEDIMFDYQLITKAGHPIAIESIRISIRNRATKALVVDAETPTMISVSEAQYLWLDAPEGLYEVEFHPEHSSGRDLYSVTGLQKVNPRVAA